MGNKKKKLSDELLDLKMSESDDLSLDSEALDINLEDEHDYPVEADQGETRVNGSDQTIRLVHTSTGNLPPAPNDQKKQEVESVEKGSPKEYHEEVKVSYGLPSKQQAPRSTFDPYDAVEGHLKQSEHLRIAQRKINDLEDEVSKLRRENEELASAGETFRKLNDEYYNEIENLKMKGQDHKQTSHQEITLLKKINQNKEKQILELKQQIDEYKSRIDNNFHRVRKREKDLEHRLEIAKIEEAAVIKSKDQLILDLKRRIDEVSTESDNFRKKSQENYKELQKKQQVVRGVIRALRIALTKLEGDDDSDYIGENTDSGIDDSE